MANADKPLTALRVGIRPSCQRAVNDDRLLKPEFEALPHGRILGTILSAGMIMATDTLSMRNRCWPALQLDEGFHPQEIRSEKETGLSATLIEDLILKYLSGLGSAAGRAVADHLCLPLAVLEPRYAALRTRQEISPVSSGMLGDHVYRLTDQGRDKAQRAIRACAYAGPAPVPLEDYVNSVQAQNIRCEKPRRKQLEAALPTCSSRRNSWASSGRRSAPARECSSTALPETAKRRLPSG